MRTGIVYVYTSLESGKKYVGQTTRGMDIRHKEHFKKVDGHGKFKNAIRKYGIEGFKLEILEDSVVLASSLKSKMTVLDELEIKYIEKYDSMNNGYNSTLGGGGCLGFKQTQTHIKKKKCGYVKNNESKR